MDFRRVIIVQGEEMNHASIIYAEMNESWNQLTSTKSELRSQLASVEFSERRGQQDLSVRI